MISTPPELIEIGNNSIDPLEIASIRVVNKLRGPMDGWGVYVESYNQNGFYVSFATEEEAIAYHKELHEKVNAARRRAACQK